MTEALIEDALTMAFDRREAKPGLIVHLDRGVQYRSQRYVDCLNAKDCQVSTSPKRNCWDNVPMESFYSRLKVELIYAKNYQSVDEARSGIFSYIEIFYNRKRRHLANGGASPAVFEKKAALAAQVG
jgi:transposase InsO family protein